MSALWNKNGASEAESDGPIMTAAQLKMVWHWHNEARLAATAVEYWLDHEPPRAARLAHAKERLAEALAALEDAQKLE
jgi:hypothetical protein